MNGMEINCNSGKERRYAGTRHRWTYALDGATKSLSQSPVSLGIAFVTLLSDDLRGFTVNARTFSVVLIPVSLANDDRATRNVVIYFDDMIHMLRAADSH